MDIFTVPDENIRLPNGNIGLPERVGHGRTGTSAWFFPFTRVLLPFRSRGEVIGVSGVNVPKKKAPRLRGAQSVVLMLSR